MSIVQFINRPAPLAWEVAAAIFGSTGEGGLYDPSALDMIFQDATGTTPAVPGSPVGLVLDAREEMGPELVSESGWSSTGNVWDVSVPGEATVTNASAQSELRVVGQSSNAFPGAALGKSYVYEFDYDVSSGSVLVYAFSASPISVSGTGKFSIVRTNTGSVWSRIVATAGTTARIWNWSVREVLNPPLTQPTTAARPILARMPLTGRRNLLTLTEDFSNEAWLKNDASIVGNKLIESANNAPHRIRQNIISVAGIHIAFFDVQAAERTHCEIWVGNASPTIGGGARFDLINGTVVNSRTVGGASVAASGVIPLGMGIYRCYVAVDSSAENPFAHLFIIAPGTPLSSISYQGDGVSGINVYRSQLSFGIEPTPYQRVTNAYDVTEAGVPDAYSLVYDLADDALTTTLPQAINGDILIAGTKGSIIEPVSYAAGSTFTLGPDTYTDGTPGIMRAIGDIVGVLLIDRTLTQTERDVLIEHYKGKGAKGLLVPGPELVVNGDFSDGLNGWSVTSEGTGSVSVSEGRAVITSTDGSNYGAITQSVPIEEGSTYLLDFHNAGPQGSYIQFANVLTGNRNTGPTREVVRAYATGNSSFLLRVAANSGTASFDDISIRELRAEEDWT